MRPLGGIGIVIRTAVPGFTRERRLIGLVRTAAGNARGDCCQAFVGRGRHLHAASVASVVNLYADCRQPTALSVGRFWGWPASRPGVPSGADLHRPVRHLVHIATCGLLVAVAAVPTAATPIVRGTLLREELSRPSCHHDPPYVLSHKSLGQPKRRPAVAVTGIDGATAA